MSHREISHQIHRSSPHAAAGVAAFPPAPDIAEQACRVLAAPAQDPHVLWYAGLYYYCESSAAGISIRIATTFLDFGSAPGFHVWAPPHSGPASRNVWAPELHRIDGRFYIYFAADDGRNAHHRMWVLRSRTDDPLGPYQLLGPLETNGWAIDGTVLTTQTGEHVFIWSGWPGRRDGRQNLYFARMKDPTTLAGPRVLLTMPTESWEKRGMPICEGPQILQRGGRTFIVYSASGSWTEDYCLGLLAHDGGDIMDATNWRKLGPVFSKNEHGCGVGHCGFATTPDGEDWILYHAKTSRLPGWADREVRAQKMAWNFDGLPVFGAPAPVSIEQLPAAPVTAELFAKSA